MKISRHLFPFLSVSRPFAGILTAVAVFSLFVLTDAASAQSPQIPQSVLTTIEPEVDFEEVYQRADMPEILASIPDPDPDLADDIRFQKEFWAGNVRFSRPIYCLQFSFKPLRIVTVDIPNKEARLDRKLVYYLAYKVENTDVSIVGELDQATPFPVKHDATVEDCDCEFCKQAENPDAVKKIEMDAPLTIKNEPGTFKPKTGLGLEIQPMLQFILASDGVVLDVHTELDEETGAVRSEAAREEVAYVDQYIPLAIPVIMRREGFRTIPETTLSIAKKTLKPGESCWGVAMWTDIDPRISKFSIYVSGLTNAYRWTDKKPSEDGAYQPGDMLGTGRSMEQRVLKLNWWRLGDAHMIHEKEIKYGWPGALDYEWVYR